jgi:hypothetical protein
MSALKGKVSKYVKSLIRPPSEEVVLANLQEFLLDTSFWNRHSTPLNRVTFARFIAMLDEELATVSSYGPITSSVLIVSPRNNVGWCGCGNPP